MNNRSDGSTASYYELPPGCTELQDLISYRNLNAQDGEMFRAIYRKGRASHSDELRDARKVLFYAKAEVKRLEALGAAKESVMVGLYKMSLSHVSITESPDNPSCKVSEFNPPALMQDDSDRMAAIGQNGNDGEVYAALDARKGSRT